MVILAKKENNRDSPITTTTTSDANISNAGYVSKAGNVNETDNKDNDPLTGDDIRQVNAVDKIFKVSEALERRFENKFNRNQPISFGEKLGEKIEARMTDTIIDKMMTGMFNVGGSSIKPDGWLAVVKTVLDSGFAQHAGANLHLTIESLGKTIGKQKTEQLADAVVQAVGPKKGVGTSTEDEQRKMEEHVLSLNRVNIVDIRKFMDLVNANPANAQITDIDQARNILIEEQDRIRRDRKLLSPGIEENLDIDRGQRMGPPISQRDNFLDSMMSGNMSGAGGAGSSNKMTSEQILTLDPNSNESITAYAWSQGHGQILQEPNGLNKVRNILMRHQDDLMKQATGLGGSIEQPAAGIGSIGTVGEQTEDTDYKWDNEDIGKKGVGKMDKKGEVLVPPHIEAKENQSQIASQQEAQNSIMELLQKMANNFDNGVNELNNKLQMMENRINNIESSTLPIQPAKIPIDTETPIEIPTEIIQNTINDLNLQEEQKEDDQDLQEKVDVESIEPILVESNISSVNTKDTKWWKNKKDDTENDSTPKPVEELPKEMPKEIKSYPKGSQGWLKEQKALKEQKKLK